MDPTSPGEPDKAQDTRPPPRAFGRAGVAGTQLRGPIAGQFRVRATRAIASGHVFRYLAGATVVLTLASGLSVWLIDRRDFPSLGEALWWAVVTLATVGYGDVVPTSTWGRFVGSVVIVLGVTFLSLLTATVTSYFVSADQDQRSVELAEDRGETEADTRALLREMSARLDAIEEALQDIRRPR